MIKGPMDPDDTGTHYQIQRELLRDMHESQTTLAVLRTKIEMLEKKIADLVTRFEFIPVKLIAYGLAGSVLAAVIAAVMTNVLRK
jgi:hypothetical protein